ncbi:hypothetical protein AUK22_04890, partial [bacterium CG2_30_54_10]
MADDVFLKAAERLSSPSEDERKEAVLALLKLQDPRAIDLLPNVVTMDRAVDVRYLARKAYYLLRDVIPNKSGEPFLELPDGISLYDLEKLLLDENPRIRGEGIKLTERLDPGSVAPFLRNALAAEKITNLQAELITALGRSGSRNDIPTLASFLAASEPRMRANAIDALAVIGGVEALEFVVPLLRDPDNQVRTNAAKALQALDTGEMLKILRTMAMSQEVAQRESAIFTLQRYKSLIAAQILARMAAVDPLPLLQENARAALEAMAKGDENARKVLEQLNTPEEPDDPNAPATVSMEGTVGIAVTNETVPSTTSPLPRVMVVPGVTRKLVKDICALDPAQRESGLRQLSAIVKPEHAPFLLLRLEKEEDPRLVSFLLSLIGKIRVPQTYAAVIKHFKHPEPRVRANAIEAAMQIDPKTTPDRASGFLKDPNNRVRANAVIAWATRPNFDPLVWVRDLSEFGDPAYRRSALFVISRLQRPAFLPILENLMTDEDMEVRQLALKAIQEFATQGISGASEIAEVAAKLMAKEQKGSVKFDEDFHAVMVAMRASRAPKKIFRKSAKSATQEFGEQILGTDGLKKAGLAMKNLKNQAKGVREKVAVGLSQAGNSLSSGKMTEKLAWLAKLLALAVILILNAAGAADRFQAESPLRLIFVGAAALASILAVFLLVFRRPGTAVIAALLLSLAPIGAARFDIQDSDIVGGPRVVPHSGGTGVSSASEAASPTSDLQQGDGLPGEVASVQAHVKGIGSQSNRIKAPEAHGPSIRMLQPARGAKIFGKFAIKAKVAGNAKSVEFLLDDISLKTFAENRGGNFEYEAGSSADHSAGRHVIKVRVTDPAGRRSEDQLVVEFMNQLAGITISSPASGGVFWRDDRLAATVTGKGCEQVEFLLDDAVIGAFPTDPAGRYEYPVPIATLSEGMHTFKVRASMADGRQATDSVRFRALVPKPTVSFLAPKNGENVFGTIGIAIEADSGWREAAIRKVTWYADGLAKKALASPPWQDSWETGDMATGSHELKVTIENELRTIAESVIRVNVIQPMFSAAIKGIRSGQMLEEDTHASVDVVNEIPSTKVEKVVLSVDGKTFQDVTKAPFQFTVRVNDIPPGPRKLTAEAFRSDGQTFRTSLSFSAKPRNRRSLFFSTQSASGKSLPAKDLEKIRLDLKEDGKGVGSYTLQSAGAVPLHFGILIDVSDSMKSD